MPTILADRIRYADHDIILACASLSPDELDEMASQLSADGDMRQHARELRRMNNDGSWRIKAIR